jgi:hypothetical protein
MKPDVIVAWPDNCDYPLWRKFIRENRDRFNDVIIVITRTYAGFNYSDFIIEQLRDICIIEYSPVLSEGQDWRNVAVNFGLSLSKSNYVWFTEQDFYPNSLFWISFYFANSNQIIAGVFQNERLHPCCILCPREVVELTRKNFGVVPNVSDHFALFQQDIRGYTIEQISQYDYEHLNGLSSNFYLMSEGGLPNYQPERFKQYVIDSLKSKEVLHPHFKEVCDKYLEKVL